MKFRTYTRRQWRSITADRKRFATLCVLSAMALLLWARIIVIARPPRTAVADPIAQSKAAEVPPKTRAARAVSLDHAVLRNPFRMNEATFPSTATDNIGSSAGGGEAEDGERSLVAALALEGVMPKGPMALIDGRIYRPGDTVALHAAADPVLLEEVRARSVILAAGDRRYELTIAPPGR